MAQQLNKSIIVKGDASQIFASWADFERFPKIMERVESVEKTSEDTSHWVVRGPGDRTLQWDAKTTTFERGQRIAWNSTCGNVNTTGQVTFTQLPRQQTQITITLQYTLSASMLDSVAAEFIRHADRGLLELLRDFKRFIEQHPPTNSRRDTMAVCEVCGNDYDKAFEVVLAGATHTFDSFECAIQALAPVCANCDCRVIGHGVEADGTIYCCAHCAEVAGVTALTDRA